MGSFCVDIECIVERHSRLIEVVLSDSVICVALCVYFVASGAEVARREGLGNTGKKGCCEVDDLWEYKPELARREPISGRGPW